MKSGAERCGAVSVQCSVCAVRCGAVQCCAVQYGEERSGAVHCCVCTVWWGAVMEIKFTSKTSCMLFFM